MALACAHNLECLGVLSAAARGSVAPGSARASARASAPAPPPPPCMTLGSIWLCSGGGAAVLHVLDRPGSRPRLASGSAAVSLAAPW